MTIVPTPTLPALRAALSRKSESALNPTPDIIKRTLYRVEALLAALSLLLLLLLSLAQIVARNVFDTGLPLADALTRYLVLYVAMLGAVLAVDGDRHIKIDFAVTVLPRAGAYLRRPFHVLSALICALLSAAAWRFWREEWQYAVEGERWIALLQFILPAGFALLAVHFLILGLSRERRHGTPQ